MGGTEVFPGIAVDAPTMIAWQHENGIRGVWDITLAPDMYLRSDYYTNDERWEITGRSGYARVNRCTGQRHSAAEPRGLPRRRNALVPCARRRLGQQLPRFGPALAALAPHGGGPMLWSAEEAMDVLRFALAVYASSEAGGTGVNPASVS